MYVFTYKCTCISLYLYIYIISYTYIYIYHVYTCTLYIYTYTSLSLSPSLVLLEPLPKQAHFGRDINLTNPSPTRTYLESQWPMIMGYLVSVMSYFGVEWPVVLGHLAFQVLFTILEPLRALESLLFGYCRGVRVRWGGLKCCRKTSSPQCTSSTGLMASI